MKKSFSHLVRGYLQVQMTGFHTERFLNLCRHNQIELWDIYCRNHTDYFKADLKGYRQIRPLVKKTGVHLKLLGKYGLPFTLYQNRKRKPFAVGFFCFFLLLYLLTRFIWDINIDDNYHFTDDTLMHWLSSQGVVYGMQKRKIDCAKLEEDIRTSFPEIIWVSARVSGTRLLIRIKENTVVSNIPETITDPADLVSDKNGIITEMIVRQGKALVKPGDEVKPGQILVSGMLPIYDDSEQLVTAHYVRADADIVAETTEVLRKSIPKRILDYTYTGNNRFGVGLCIGRQAFVWMLPDFKKRLWNITADTRQVTLVGDFYLPVWITILHARAYEPYERSRTKQELEQEKEFFHMQNEKNFTEKGVVIIRNDVKILDKHLNYEIQEQYLLHEPIGRLQRMTESKENKQPDECN